MSTVVGILFLLYMVVGLVVATIVTSLANFIDPEERNPYFVTLYRHLQDREAPWWVTMAFLVTLNASECQYECLDDVPEDLVNDMEKVMLDTTVTLKEGDVLLDRWTTVLQRAEGENHA